MYALIFLRYFIFRVSFAFSRFGCRAQSSAGGWGLALALALVTVGLGVGRERVEGEKLKVSKGLPFGNI